MVLPKEVVQALHTAEGEALHPTEIPAGGYHLAPYDPDFERRMRQVEDIASRYRDALRALSK